MQSSVQNQSIAIQSPQSQPQQQVINKTGAPALPANDIVNQNSTAPPLPPRKTAQSSGTDQSVIYRMLKPQQPQPCVTSASSLVNLTNNPNLTAALSKSSENITSNEFEVPKTIAPPVPKHKTPTDDIDDNLKRITDDLCEKVIVGPAETITGIIDTRPLEARKPIGGGTTGIMQTMNLTTSSTNCMIDSKTITEPIETITKLTRSNTNYHELPRGGSNIGGGNSSANNLYHLKMSRTDEQQHQQSIGSQSHQMRHQSYPNHFQSSGSSSIANSQPSKSQTISSLSQHQQQPQSQPQSHRAHAINANHSNHSTTTTAAEISTQPKPYASSHSDHNHQKNAANDLGNGTNSATASGNIQPLLYENITIKDCNVPYENINLEYIARLMNEGYSKENVITALGISRNNIEMACDILHEFVSKSGA